MNDIRDRARKVFPQYGEGPLVKVAWAKNQAEAELIAGLLLEEGVPSLIQRSGGFDVPDFLAAGPRDILVAASGADRAREVLAPVQATPAAEPVKKGPGPFLTGASWLLLALILVSLGVAVGVAVLR